MCDALECEPAGDLTPHASLQLPVVQVDVHVPNLLMTVSQDQVILAHRDAKHLFVSVYA